MPLLVKCPRCGTFVRGSAKECRTKTGKGCGRKFVHGEKVYYAQYRDPNGRTRQKKIGPSKKAAQNFLRDVEKKIAEKKYIDVKECPKVLIKNFVEEHYKPWCKTYNREGGYKTKKAFLKAVVEEWGNKFLDEITDKDIDTYRWRMMKAKKKVMFNRVFSTLSHIYTIAMERDLIKGYPFSTARKRFKENSRLRYLLPKEVAKLLDACSDHLRPIVELALHTGMRKGELLSLRLDKEVNLKEKRITLGVEKQTKNAETRHIPLNASAYSVLVKASEGKEPGDYLFTWNGKPIKDVKKAWATALKEAKIEDFHFHDLRHTFASNLAMNGVDLFVLKELLGHKDIKMTQKYAHLSPDCRARVVTVLDDLFSVGKNNEKKSEIHQSVISQSVSATA